MDLGYSGVYCIGVVVVTYPLGPVCFVLAMVCVQYLVRLKRLQLELEESWALMRIQRKSPSHGGCARG